MTLHQMSRVEITAYKMRPAASTIRVNRKSDGEEKRRELDGEYTGERNLVLPEQQRRADTCQSAMSIIALGMRIRTA